MKPEGEETTQTVDQTNSGEEFTEALKKARETSWRCFGRRIRFYAPSFMPYRNRYWNDHARLFPSISITGRSCTLKCKHCDGRLLETMIPAESPSDLARLFQELHRRNGEGCLVSGGCTQQGAVPLKPFLDVIREAKRKLGLKVVVHTGLVNEDLASELAKAEVDAALIDVIGSDETIKEICRLDGTVKDYDASLSALEAIGISTVPHVLVGLHYGRMRGEFKALEMISHHRPAAIIVIAFTPLPRTPMAQYRAPSADDIASVIIEARRLMPKVPTALGCARPKGNTRKEIDCLAVRAGVNAVAYPDPEAISLAEKMKLERSFSGLCCSQVYEELR